MKTYLTSLLVGLLLAASSFSLTACTSETVAEAAHLVLEAKVADTIVQTGEPVDTVMTADLSEQETERVLFAIQTYDTVRLKWTDAPDSAGNAAAALLSVASDYATLYGEYTAVKQIVQGHWPEYTPVQQDTLRGYDERAQRIHFAVQAVLAQGQGVAEATSSMLSLGMLIAQTVAV